MNDVKAEIDKDADGVPARDAARILDASVASLP